MECISVRAAYLNTGVSRGNPMLRFGTNGLVKSGARNTQICSRQLVAAQRAG
jgi:hypothetical protein